jgi:8-oxo-dGTP pyrophosphatase MutT (NUDIX family)
MGYIEELRKIVGHRPLIFVGAVAIITDHEGRILFQQRKFPHGVWGIPGGLMELGESTEEVARREVKEETGLTIGKLHLINVYSGKEHFIVAENGDEFYVVTVAYYTNDFSGDFRVDETESIQFKFFHPNNLPERMVGSHREVIKDYLYRQGESL